MKEFLIQNWPYIVTILFCISEALGLSKKAESNAVLALLVAGLKKAMPKALPKVEEAAAAPAEAPKAE